MPMIMKYTMFFVVSVVVAAVLLFSGAIVFAQDSTSVRVEARATAEQREADVTTYRDVDSDNDSIPDSEEDARAEAEASASGSVDAGAESASYNNSRSNRATVEGDGGGDTDTDAEQANYNNSRSNRSTISGSASTDDGVVHSFSWEQVGGPMIFRLGNVPAADKAEQSLRGITIAREATATAGGDLDGDGYADVSLRVDAEAVRGWDPATKEAVRARLAEANEKTGANDFGLMVAREALENERIREIVVRDSERTGEEEEGGEMRTDAEVSVSYTGEVRFLGLFKRAVSMVATADADGTVRTRYDKSTPLLMQLLSWKGDQSVFTEVAHTVQQRLGRMKTGDVTLER